jgi:hypothetical protein
MKKRGRPSKFDPKMLAQAKFLARRGCTDRDLAEFFGVDEKTINTWKAKHPEFLQSLKAGKHESDTAVERSLYERAMGYSHPEDKIFQYDGKPLVVPTVKHYPPDTVAAIFWLKNRRPERWREKVEHEVNGDLEITVSIGGNAKAQHSD